MNIRNNKMSISKIFKCKPKELKEIKFKTPEGNEVDGYIAYTFNEFKGSIYTKLVNGEFNEQILRGFPKLHSFGESSPFYRGEIDFREKEDGTNIGFTALMDSDKTIVLETFPRNRRILTEKNRESPVIDDQFLDMLSTINTNKYHNFVQKYGGSIFFELFGSNNPHEINYSDVTDLDIRFLFGYDNNGHTYNNKILNDIEKYEKFKRPNKSFELEYIDKEKLIYHLEPTMDFIDRYISYIDDNLNDFLLSNKVNNPKEIYNSIKYIYDEINKNSLTKDNGYIGEGCVWTGFSKEDKNLTIQIKNKPSAIEELHSFPHGIPKIMIRKSLRTFTENIGNNYLYSRDKMIQWINADLKEDILDEKVDMPETQERIIEIVKEYCTKNTLKPNILAIVNTLISNNQEMTIEELMRKFAEIHPEHIQYSNKVYQYLSSIL